MFGPKLGYNVSSFIDFNEAGISPDIVTIVQNALPVVLVLHPVLIRWLVTPLPNILSVPQLARLLYLYSHSESYHHQCVSFHRIDGH